MQVGVHFISTRVRVSAPEHDNFTLSPRERERLDRTLAMLPSGLQNGLEIGFYDFRLTDRLRESIDLVSIDLPRPVSNHKDYSLVFADIQNLPFADRAFDLVFCTEVLEHLSDSVLTNAVRELQRVCRKYLLVSIPYQQKVWNEMFKCSECGYVGHSMGHLRYCDESDLHRWFDKMILHKIEFVGRVNGYAPRWLYSAAYHLGNAWIDYNFGMCPRCEKTDRAPRPNLFGHLLRRLIWRAEHFAKSRPAWVLVVFQLPESARS
jgi:hypothetical protein